MIVKHNDDSTPSGCEGKVCNFELAEALDTLRLAMAQPISDPLSQGKLISAAFNVCEAAFGKDFDS